MAVPAPYLFVALVNLLEGMKLLRYYFYYWFYLNTERDYPPTTLFACYGFNVLCWFV